MLAALLQCSAGRQSQSCSIHRPQNARSPGTPEMRDKCVDRCLLTSLGCDLSSLEVTFRQFWHRQQSWDSSMCCKLPYFVVKATQNLPNPSADHSIQVTIFFSDFFFLFLSCLHWEETCLRNSLAYATTTAIRANLNSQHWDGNRNNNYPAQQIKNRSGKSVISASMTVKKKNIYAFFRNDLSALFQMSLVECNEWTPLNLKGVQCDLVTFRSLQYSLAPGVLWAPPNLRMVSDAFCVSTAQSCQYSTQRALGEPKQSQKQRSKQIPTLAPCGTQKRIKRV